MHARALALITAEILEGIRDGRAVSDLMSFGTTILVRGEVMEGVPEMLDEVQVEGTFPDGKITDEHCFEWVFDRDDLGSDALKGLVAESAGPMGTGGMAAKLKAAQQAARAG